MGRFRLVSNFTPKGDQPQAIRQLVKGIKEGRRFQTLLGVTGSGKTYVMAKVIEAVQKPTLVISHNKTLAAQLYGEFRSFFPYNAVEYFISYYDYYQPEAYVPQTDTYIEKDASINEEIERLRIRATSALMEREDVIIVASVSCIYNLGSPDEFRSRCLILTRDQQIDRDDLLNRLISIHYQRNDIEFLPGTFRVKGDVVEIFPAHERYGQRIEFFDEVIERIRAFDPISGKVSQEKERVVIYPARHFLTSPPTLKEAIENIRKELKERVEELTRQKRLVEAQRLLRRTNYDLEMLEELGYCPGIENYSMHLSGRKPGERPPCLIDYFPEEYLMIIDESHVTIPQIQGMYNGDRSRKETLVEYGFRLPSALENRPQRFDEFESLINQVIFTSATPGPYELEKCKGEVVELLVRPTGIVDPEVVIKPVENQVEDLIGEIKKVVEAGERVLVTTLTKRMAEDLADYLVEVGFRVKYMHSEIDSLERVSILRGLRLGDFDILVGINLLREGLDLPEVGLVAILDADKEGFLRSETSLIQTAGRAARNVRGKVIMYADELTDSIRRALKEMERRRRKQIEYNRRHGIKPKSVVKTREEIMKATAVADERKEKEGFRFEDTIESLARLKQEMERAAKRLEFEKAAAIRDRIIELRRKLESY
ncbi:excinuclease ABC subunit B [candidate division WOR-3 bacterium]|uniref:UvrABC system protein B n=1 Tax=candidate division WOR-3 bacterium TaxID=2052148 RepID=A0A660SCN7_UNCW3|nr:MAG: excinuclease ABC subunit B [candidate division WOR-3 bacterium]